MIRLVSSELQRAIRRPLTRRLVLAALGVIAVSGMAVFLSHEYISDDALIDEREVVATACREAPPHGIGEVPPAVLPQACAEFARREVDDPSYHLATGTDGVLELATLGVGLISWIIGGSLIGADWQSRSLTTLLTWEPRRLRVIAAKVLAIVILIGALSFAGLALTGAAMLPSAIFRGTTVEIDASWWWAMGSQVLRGTALGIFAAVTAFSLAMIGRATSAALGVGFAILLVENIAGGLEPEWRRFTLLGNSIVFVVGEDNAGEVLNRSYHAAAAILVVLATVMLAAAVSSFRRQEVG